MSFLFALLMIVEIALWHKEGMSSMLCGSVSWRIFEICVGVWVVSLGLGRGFVCMAVVHLVRSWC